MKAIMQNDGERFFGIGQTVDDARADALNWTDTLADTEVVEITEALADEIEARGGDVPYRRSEGDVVDVA